MMILLTLASLAILLFVVTPGIMIGLGRFYSALPLSCKESLILCLQISGVSIIFQFLQLAVMVLLPQHFP